MSAVQELLEPGDLLRMPDAGHYELIDGVPVEKKMGAESDEIASTVNLLVKGFVLRAGLGRVYGSQTGFQCFPSKPGQVRMPDTSFVAQGRLPGDKSPKGHVKIAPDLAVEVVSPNETYEEVQVKVMDYKDAKVRLIWVVSPETKTVLVRRLDGTCAEVGEAGELSGEDVLPGFACKVADLFV